MSYKKSSTPLSSSTCHLHLHLPLLAKLWKGRNCACSFYPGLKATIICLLYVLMVSHNRWGELFVLPKSWKNILGQTTCMMEEYTFKWLPTSLPCITPLNMSMSHSQYLLFRNSGIVSTGISEVSLCIYMGVRHTVWPINLVNKGVNYNLISLFFLLTTFSHARDSNEQK